MNILCVDDEPLALDLATAMCEELPQAPDVVGFARAREALGWLDANHADIALLDISMPDMNGLDLAREVKRISPDTAIVFVTGHSEYAVSAFEMHASGYVLKPLNRERLQAEVEHAIAQGGGVQRGLPASRRGRLAASTCWSKAGRSTSRARRPRSFSHTSWTGRAAPSPAARRLRPFGRRGPTTGRCKSSWTW